MNCKRLREDYCGQSSWSRAHAIQTTSQRSPRSNLIDLTQKERGQKGNIWSLLELRDGTMTCKDQQGSSRFDTSERDSTIRNLPSKMILGMKSEEEFVELCVSVSQSTNFWNKFKSFQMKTFSLDNSSFILSSRRQMTSDLLQKSMKREPSDEFSLFLQSSFLFSHLFSHLILTDFSCESIF